MHSVFHAFTHSVVWASVIASAFIAVITTLLVEYLAKPWLEVRKDRILENGQEKRAAIKAVGQAISLSDLLQAYKNSVPEHIPAEYLRTTSAQLSEKVSTAFSALIIPESVLGQWSRVTAIFNTFAFSAEIGRPPAEAWKGLESATDELGIFYDYFRVPKWRLLHRKRLIEMITSYYNYEDTEEVIEDEG